MKHLFDGTSANEIKTRLAKLGPANERQWGKMAAAQALAHCAITMEWAVGDGRPPRMFLGRILGGLVKPKVVANDKPMGRNAPTAKSLIIENQRDLTEERERLGKLIDRFVAAGPKGCTTHPHTFFGPLTPDEWAILMYKHLDHHLRQFGA